MARLKNATFVGSPPRDVARDAPVLTRWLTNAASDAALTYDKMTGLNGEANTINHTGSGRGCPLSMPIVNQGLDAQLASSAGAGDYYIWGAPIFIGPGGPAYEAYMAEVDIFHSGPWFPISCEVRSTAWVLSDAGALDGGSNDRFARFKHTLRGSETISAQLALSPGWQYLLIRATIPANTTLDASRLRGVRCYPMRASTGESNGIAPLDITSASANPYPVPAALSSWTDIDSGQVADDGPLDAWVLTKTNRNLSALWEYVTGAPVPGNAFTTMANTVDNTSPAAEPLLAMPMGSWGTGAADALASKPSDLTLFERRPTTQAGSLNISRTWVQFPVFSSANNPGHIRVLITGLSGTPTNWRVTATTAAGSSSTVALTLISAGWYTALITNLPYTSSVGQFVALALSHATGGAVVNEPIYLVGWSLAFDP